MRITRLMYGFALTCASLLASTQVHAVTPQFKEFSPEQFDRVIKELSANSTLHSVTPPSSYGSIFGFELGLVGGATQTPEIDKLVKEQSADADAKYFPHAGILGAVTVPFGITGELVAVPEIDASGVKYSQYALALKWTVTDTLLPMLPVNIAVRGFMSKTEFSFNQRIQNSETPVPVDATVTYDGLVKGVQLMVSPKLIPIIEPYAGIGYLTANGKMGVEGAASADLFTFTDSQSAETSPTSTQFFVGADIRLLLIGIGVEYSRSFGTDSLTGKFSLRF